MPSKLTGLVALGASLALLALLAWAIGDRVDGEAVLAAWRALDPRHLAAALACGVVNILVMGRRWALLVAWTTPARPSTLRLAGVTWMSGFVAHGAPAAAFGDLARMAAIRLSGGLGTRDAVQTVIFDRLTGLIALVTFGWLALLIQALLAAPVTLLTGQAVMLAIGTLAPLLAIALAGHPWVARFARLRPLFEAARAYRGVIGDGGRLLAQGLLGAATVTLIALIFWLLGRGMGLDLTLARILLFAPAILLINNLPVLYLGWGGREAAVLAALGASSPALDAALGPALPASQAIALSVAFGLAFLLTSLPGGLFLLSPVLRGRAARTTPD
jgi:uncharacterized membrane protein YbhN (UPF0104 family)